MEQAHAKLLYMNFRDCLSMIFNVDEEGGKGASKSSK